MMQKKIFKKTKIFLLIYILISFLFNFCYLENFSPIEVKAEDIFVGENSANFSSIQNAVYSAESNDVIHVKTGIYLEQITINKTVRITAEPGTEVSATDAISNFYLNCNNTTIEGFRITDNNIGVFIESGFSNKILNNTFKGNKNSVYLSNTSFNMISDNYFISNTEGIRLFQSSENIIQNNYFTDHSSKSIYLWDESNSNEIFNNNISSEGSISLSRWCKNNLIYNNYLHESGINLHKCFNNIISYNVIKEAGKGVVLSYSSNNSIIDNKFEKCETCGIYKDNSENNVITSNHFIDTPETIKEKPQAPKIKIPGFEILFLIIGLVFFGFFRKKFIKMQ